jgi:hypothetical protein
MFVYQRNLERAAGAEDALDDELMHAITAEIHAAFPALAPPVEAGSEAPVAPARRRSPVADDDDLH